MGKDTESTIYNIGYPIYGAKFLDDSTLLVTGGGGEGNNGIPNKISALKIDFTKKKIVKRFRELSLDDRDDSPTTLDCSNNIILVGCNEGSEKIKSGQGNNHLRKYVYHNEHLKFVASIDLDGSTKPEDYTKLTCISSDASVAAIASSKVPTIIRIVNPANLRETYEVETGNDVKDLHFSPDGKVLSYITASTLEVMSVVTGNFIVRKTDFDSNCTLSKIRFIDQDNVIIAATLTKGTGIVLIKVSLKSGVAKIVKSKLITNKFKGATSLDVDLSGRLVAIAGNENSVVVVTLRNLRVVKFMKQVHSFAITRLVFSPDSKLLASVSAANTVHILKISPTLATSQSLMESTVVFFTNAIIVLIVAALAYYGKEHDVHIKALHFAQSQYKKLTEKNDSSNYFVLHEYPEQTTLVGAVHSAHTSSGSYRETTISFSPEATVGPHETSADDFVSYTTDSSITDTNTHLDQLSFEDNAFKSDHGQEYSSILAISANQSSEKPYLSSDTAVDTSTQKVEKETLIESYSSGDETIASESTSSKHIEEEDTMTLVVESAKKTTEVDLTPTFSQVSVTDLEKTEETVAHEVISQKKTDDDKSASETGETIKDALVNDDEEIASSSDSEAIPEATVDIPIERTVSIEYEESTIETQSDNQYSDEETNITEESNHDSSRVEIETSITLSESFSAVATETSVEISEPQTSSVESSDVETHSAATSMKETSTVETSTVETSTVETSTVETIPEETNTAERSSVDASVVETSSVEGVSTETSSLDAMPEETNAVETSSVEKILEEASPTVASESTFDVLEEHIETTSPILSVAAETSEVDEEIVTITEVSSHKIEAEISVDGQTVSAAIESMTTETSEELPSQQKDTISSIVEVEKSFPSTTTHPPSEKSTDSVNLSEEEVIVLGDSNLDLDASLILTEDIETETVIETEIQTAEKTELYMEDEL